MPIPAHGMVVFYVMYGSLLASEPKTILYPPRDHPHHNISPNLKYLALVSQVSHFLK